MCSNHLSHSLRRVLKRFMLPNTHDGPTGIIERCIGLAISLDVPSELRLPVPDIAPGHSTVLWTDVPEATVHKHSDLSTSEDNVRTDSQAVDLQPVVLAEAQAPGMERGPKRRLRL